MKHSSKGISAVAVPLAILVLCVVGLAGYKVGKSDKTKDKDKHEETSVTVQQNESTPVNDVSERKSFSLATGNVTFSAPKNWTIDGVGCKADSNMYGSQEYLESVALLPGEKLQTIYGNGTEFFHVNVCVFRNKNNSAPKDWLETGIDAGLGFPTDEISSDPINGNNAYYRKQTEGYTEVNYVLTGSDKVVHINARLFETSDSAPGVGDFMKFESAVKELTKTVVIN